MLEIPSGGRENSTRKYYKGMTQHSYGLDLIYMMEAKLPRPIFFLIAVSPSLLLSLSPALPLSFSLSLSLSPPLPLSIYPCLSHSFSIRMKMP